MQATIPSGPMVISRESLVGHNPGPAALSFMAPNADSRKTRDRVICVFWSHSRVRVCDTTRSKKVDATALPGIRDLRCRHIHAAGHPLGFA